MKKLISGYRSDVDKVDKVTWHKIISNFKGANVYQTWSYDSIRCGRKNISHLVLKKNNKIVAAAQSRIIKVPYLCVGIAYIRWGPLWRVKENKDNPEAFAQVLRALRNEYSCKRGLVLRIYPLIFDDESLSLLRCLQEEGFLANDNIKQERTLIVDLSPTLEELRKGLKQKWRNCLNRAERNKLEIIEGHDEDLFEKFLIIYREMLERKKFGEPNDINEFRSIQKDFPLDLKMKIFLCRFNGEISVGGICSGIGNTGLYLFGATNLIGMKSNGSYLIQWKIIEWLKSRGCTHYDLNGINPETNPGTHRFKTGLCGKNGRDVKFLGQFETFTNPLSSFTVKSGEKMKLCYQGAKSMLKKLYCMSG